MCYSATASFTTAALLTAVGVGTTRLITQKRQLFLALIPFLFALQQLQEGFMWAAYPDADEFARIAGFGKYVFLFMAVLVWPVWIPLALYAVEQDATRKRVLAVFLAIGILYDAIMLVEFFLAPKTVGVGIIGRHIQYALPGHPNNFYGLLYFATTLIPPFISSWRFMWVMGLLNFIGLVVTQRFFEPAFVSVWCFIAAIMSVCLYFIMRFNIREKSMN